MPSLTTPDDRNVDYDEYHLRTGPVPILFLASERSFWAPVARLMPWDYYVATLAWSGSVDRMAQDVAGFAQAMKMPFAHLVGYGAGARAALLVALDNPKAVRSITALDPFAGATDYAAALPWTDLNGLTTPTLLLEVEGTAASAQAALDRLLSSLPNAAPELVREWNANLKGTLPRRLATRVVTQVETAYDGTTPMGVVAR